MVAVPIARGGDRRIALPARAAWVADLALVVGLAAGALLVRLPSLWTIPSLTDEANEVLLGLDIAQGKVLPATNIAIYLSPAYNYVLAALFWLVGPSPLLPRLLVLLTGILTIPTTYLLARDLANAGLRPSDGVAAWPGRLAGVVAAALLAANGGHALVNSHVAWSHATTPLFATLGLWLLHRAVRRDDVRGLLPTALVLGIMVQSHTTAVALLPGALAYVVLRRPRWLGHPRVWLAGLAFLGLNLNLLLYNLATGGNSLGGIRAATAAYARAIQMDADPYLAKLSNLGLGLLRLVGGAVDVRADADAYLRDPLVWLAAGLAMAGVLLGIRRRDPLVACVAVPYALLFAYFNAKYHVVPNARYLTPILPLAFAAMGLALAQLAAFGHDRFRRATVSAAVALALVLVSAALWSLGVRTEQLAPSVEASRAVLGAVTTLQQHRHADEPVALDPDLDKFWLDGGGDYHRALRFHLALRGFPVADLETRPRGRQGAIDSCGRGRLELRRVQPALTPAAPRLVSDDPSTGEDESLRPYWLFRTVQPRDRARDTERGQQAEWSAIVAEYRPPIGASARAIDRCAPGLPI